MFCLFGNDWCFLLGNLLVFICCAGHFFQLYIIQSFGFYLYPLTIPNSKAWVPLHTPSTMYIKLVSAFKVASSVLYSYLHVHHVACFFLWLIWLFMHFSLINVFCFVRNNNPMYVFSIRSISLAYSCFVVLTSESQKIYLNDLVIYAAVWFIFYSKVSVLDDWLLDLREKWLAPSRKGNNHIIKIVPCLCWAWLYTPIYILFKKIFCMTLHFFSLFSWYALSSCTVTHSRIIH